MFVVSCIIIFKYYVCHVCFFAFYFHLNSSTEKETATSKEVEMATKYLKNNTYCHLSEDEHTKYIDVVRSSSANEPQSSTPFVITVKATNPNERAKWSDVVEKHMKSVYRSNSLARSYAAEIFFPLEDWPAYMVELFVLNDIASYSYVTRNKICLFFWGNGSTIKNLFALSEMFAPKVPRKTHEQQKQFEESTRKCIGLFETYEEQKMNPNYSQKYYYYSLMENRMLYMDGRPRHFAKRQEDPRLDLWPAWAPQVKRFKK